MKISLLVLLSFFSVSSFADSICTFENTSETELSSTLAGVLEDLGCLEASEAHRAPDHLLVSLAKWVDKDKEIVGVNATIVNRKNGRVVFKQLKSGIRPNVYVAWRVFTQNDYDRAQAKLSLKAQKELARELSSGWIIE